MDLASYRNIVVLTGAGISPRSFEVARGDSFVEASEVLRRLDSRRSRS